MSVTDYKELWRGLCKQYDEVREQVVVARSERDRALDRVERVIEELEELDRSYDELNLDLIRAREALKEALAHIEKSKIVPEDPYVMQRWRIWGFTEKGNHEAS